MLETLQQYFSRFGIDAARTTVVVGLVYLLANIDEVLPVDGSLAYLTSVATSTSIILVIALFSHIIRRIFFPEIDLAKVANIAMKTPSGASIIFASVCAVLAALVVANVALIS